MEQKPKYNCAGKFQIDSVPTQEVDSQTWQVEGEEKTKNNILLGVSGSVAAVKVKELTQKLYNLGYNVIVVVTKSSTHFMPPLQDFIDSTGALAVYTDNDEWNNWKNMGDMVLHIELRSWADLLLIAPLSANTLAKISNGLSDNLLTCIARAWNFSNPFIVAPAMNTMMWTHPFTSKQLNVLGNELGVIVVPPQDNYLLACGEIGEGALAKVDSIVENIQQRLPL